MGKNPRQMFRAAIDDWNEEMLAWEKEPGSPERLFDRFVHHLHTMDGISKQLETSLTLEMMSPAILSSQEIALKDFVAMFISDVENILGMAAGETLQASLLNIARSIVDLKSNTIVSKRIEVLQDEIERSHGELQSTRAQLARAESLLACGELEADGSLICEPFPSTGQQLADALPLPRDREADDNTGAEVADEVMAVRHQYIAMANRIKNERLAFEQERSRQVVEWRELYREWENTKMELERQLSATQLENNTLRMDAELLQFRSQEEHERLADECKALRSEISLLVAKQDNLEEQSSLEVGALRDRENALFLEVQRLQSACDRMEVDRRAQQLSLEAAGSDIEVMKKSHKETIAGLHVQLQDCTRLRCGLQEQFNNALVNLQEEKKRSTENLLIVQREHEKERMLLFKDLEGERKKVTSSRVADRQALEHMRRKHEQEFTGARKEWITKLEAMESQLNTERGKREEIFSNLQKVLSENEHLGAHVKVLQTNIEACEKEREEAAARLSKENEETRRANHAAMQRNAECESLQGVITTLKEKICSIEKDNTTNNSQAEASKNALGNLTEELALRDNTLALTTSHLERALMELKAASEQCSSVEEELAHARLRHAKELDELERSWVAEKTALEERVQRRGSQITKERRVFEAERQRMLAEWASICDKWNGERIQFEAQLATARRNMSTLRAANVEMQTNYRALEQGVMGEWADTPPFKPPTPTKKHSETLDTITNNHTTLTDNVTETKNHALKMATKAALRNMDGKENEQPALELMR